MDTFLRANKDKLESARGEASLNIHVVLGNESCDLDSAVSALVWAYHLAKDQEATEATWDVVLPVLNIPHQDYSLRTEVTHFLSLVNHIGVSSLVFRDDIDLHSQHAAGKLVLTLVDHNTLPAGDTTLDAAVKEIIDHHSNSRRDSDERDIQVTIETVGSCSTLVAEKVLAQNPDIVDESIAKLLLGPILVDTVNLSSAAGKATAKDIAMVEALSRICPDLNKEEMYLELQQAKADMSDFTVTDILRKDFKCVSGASMNIGMSSISMHLKEFVDKPNIETELQNFCASKNLRLLVLMALTVADNGEAHRQICVYSSDSPDSMKDELIQTLEESTSPALLLSELDTNAPGLVVYNQGNVKASRKQVLPLVKEFLNRQEDSSEDEETEENLATESDMMNMNDTLLMLSSNVNNANEQVLSDNPFGIGDNQAISSPDSSGIDAGSVLLDLDPFPGNQDGMVTSGSGTFSSGDSVDTIGITPSSPSSDAMGFGSGTEDLLGLDTFSPVQQNADSDSTAKPFSDSSREASIGLDDFMSQPAVLPDSNSNPFGGTAVSDNFTDLLGLGSDAGQEAPESEPAISISANNPFAAGGDGGNDLLGLDSFMASSSSEDKTLIGDDITPNNPFVTTESTVHMSVSTTVESSATDLGDFMNQLPGSPDAINQQSLKSSSGAHAEATVDSTDSFSASNNPFATPGQLDDPFGMDALMSQSSESTNQPSDGYAAPGANPFEVSELSTETSTTTVESSPMDFNVLVDYHPGSPGSGPAVEPPDLISSDPFFDSPTVMDKSPAMVLPSPQEESSKSILDLEDVSPNQPESQSQEHLFPAPEITITETSDNDQDGSETEDSHPKGTETGDFSEESPDDVSQEVHDEVTEVEVPDIQQEAEPEERLGETDETELQEPVVDYSREIDTETDPNFAIGIMDSNEKNADPASEGSEEPSTEPHEEEDVITEPLPDSTSQEMQQEEQFIIELSENDVQSLPKSDQEDDQPSEAADLEESLVESQPPKDIDSITATQIDEVQQRLDDSESEQNGDRPFISTFSQDETSGTNIAASDLTETSFEVIMPTEPTIQDIEEDTQLHDEQNAELEDMTEQQPINAEDSGDEQNEAIAYETSDVVQKELELVESQVTLSVGEAIETAHQDDVPLESSAPQLEPETNVETISFQTADVQESVPGSVDDLMLVPEETKAPTAVSLELNVAGAAASLEQNFSPMSDEAPARSSGITSPDSDFTSEVISDDPSSGDSYIVTDLSHEVSNFQIADIQEEVEEEEDQVSVSKGAMEVHIDGNIVKEDEVEEIEQKIIENPEVTLTEDFSGEVQVGVVENYFAEESQTERGEMDMIPIPTDVGFADSGRSTPKNVLEKQDSAVLQEEAHDFVEGVIKMAKFAFLEEEHQQSRANFREVSSEAPEEQLISTTEESDVIQRAEVTQQELSIPGASVSEEATSEAALTAQDEPNKQPATAASMTEDVPQASIIQQESTVPEAEEVQLEFRHDDISAEVERGLEIISTEEPLQEPALEAHSDDVLHATLAQEESTKPLNEGVTTEAEDEPYEEPAAAASMTEEVLQASIIQQESIVPEAEEVQVEFRHYDISPEVERELEVASTEEPVQEPPMEAHSDDVLHATLAQEELAKPPNEGVTAEPLDALGKDMLQSETIGEVSSEPPQVVIEEEIAQVVVQQEESMMADSEEPPSQEAEPSVEAEVVAVSEVLTEQEAPLKAEQKSQEPVEQVDESAPQGLVISTEEKPSDEYEPAPQSPIEVNVVISDQGLQDVSARSDEVMDQSSAGKTKLLVDDSTKDVEIEVENVNQKSSIFGLADILEYVNPDGEVEGSPADPHTRPSSLPLTAKSTPKSSQLLSAGTPISMLSDVGTPLTPISMNSIDMVTSDTGTDEDTLDKTQDEEGETREEGASEKVTPPAVKRCVSIDADMREDIQGEWDDKKKLMDAIVEKERTKSVTENSEKRSPERSMSFATAEAKKHMEGVVLPDEWQDDEFAQQKLAGVDSTQEDSSFFKRRVPPKDNKPRNRDSILSDDGSVDSVSAWAERLAGDDGFDEDDDADEVPLPANGRDQRSWSNSPRKVVPIPEGLSLSMEGDPASVPSTPAVLTPSSAEMSWDDDNLQPPGVEPIPEYTAKEEMEDRRNWRKVVIANKEFTLDMRAINPYKKVLSHGGYYGDGVNAIIVIASCYMPDRSRKDYNYIMNNLFLYVISTLELLVAQEYMIVYFHGAAPKNRIPSLNWMRKCYQMIDRKLRKNLKGLFIVHPTMWLRTIIRLTRPFISSKFSRKLKFVETLDELPPLVSMEYIYVPDEVRRFDEGRKQKEGDGGALWGWISSNKQSEGSSEGDSSCYTKGPDSDIANLDDDYIDEMLYSPTSRAARHRMAMQLRRGNFTLSALQQERARDFEDFDSNGYMEDDMFADIEDDGVEEEQEEDVARRQDGDESNEEEELDLKHRKSIDDVDLEYEEEIDPFANLHPPPYQSHHRPRQPQQHPLHHHHHHRHHHHHHHHSEEVNVGDTGRPASRRGTRRHLKDSGGKVTH